jgi:hypothetical protein
MVQGSKKPSLALEASQALSISRENFGQDLDRHLAPELGV